MMDFIDHFTHRNLIHYPTSEYETSGVIVGHIHRIEFLDQLSDVISV